MSGAARSTLVEKLFERTRIARLADGLAIAVGGDVAVVGDGVSSIAIALWFFAVLADARLGRRCAGAFRSLPARCRRCCACSRLLGDGVVGGRRRRSNSAASRSSCASRSSRCCSCSSSVPSAGCGWPAAFWCPARCCSPCRGSSGCFRRCPGRSKTAGVPVKDYIIQSGEFLIVRVRARASVARCLAPPTSGRWRWRSVCSRSSSSPTSDTSRPAAPRLSR